MRDGFGRFASLRVGNGEHVQGVIVVRIFISHQAQVCDRLIVLTAVDCERCRVQALVDGFWRTFTRRFVTVADIEIEPDAFVQFPFFGVLPKHGFEEVAGLPIIVTLQGFETPLVERYGFDVGRAPLGDRGRCGACPCPERSSSVPPSSTVWLGVRLSLCGFGVRPPVLRHSRYARDRREIKDFTPEAAGKVAERLSLVKLVEYQTFWLLQLKHRCLWPTCRVVLRAVR